MSCGDVTLMGHFSQIRFDALWRHLRIAGACVGFGFIGWLFWRLMRDPQWLVDHLEVTGFVEAVVIGIAANTVIGIVFSDLVAKTAPEIGFAKRISAYYYSQIAKYIPGRVAAILVQRSILSGPRATIATIISNLELVVVSSWLCTCAALALLFSALSVVGGAVVAVVGIGIGGLLVTLDWNPLVRHILHMIPKYRISSVTALTNGKRMGRWRSIILSASIFLLPAASSYVLLINGLNIDHTAAPVLTSLLLLSWVGGVIAFVFPAGIGIRELIFFALGSAVSQAPAPELMAGIALASRLVQMLVDVAGTLLFLAIQRWSRFAQVRT